MNIKVFINRSDLVKISVISLINFLPSQIADRAPIPKQKKERNVKNNRLIYYLLVIYVWVNLYLFSF